MLTLAVPETEYFPTERKEPVFVCAKAEVIGAAAMTKDRASTETVGRTKRMVFDPV